MKISNNALNFLLAQYRAIFKRAYVKGIASAVLLTAGLAAGQAQAATSLTTLDQLPTTAEDEVVITGSDTSDGTNGQYQYLQLQTSGTGTLNGTVTINGGATSNGNYIAASGGALTLSGAGTFNVDITTKDADYKNTGINIVGDSSDATLNINAVNVIRGSLNLKDVNENKSGSVTIQADTITVGSEGSTSPVAYLTLNATSTDKSVTLGRVADSDKDIVGSEISVLGGGLLNMQGSGSSGASIVGNSLRIATGGVMLTDTGSVNQVLVDDFTVENGAFKVISGSDTVEEIFQGKTATVESGGNFLVGASGTWTINERTEGSTTIRPDVTFKAGSNVQVDGNIVVSGGLLTIESGAGLHATTAAGNGLSGSIVVAEKGTNQGLEIDSSVLKSFLTAKDTYHDITTDDSGAYITAESGSEDAAGSVVLKAGRLTFSDQSVELSDFAFKSGDGTSGAAGVIVLSGSNVIGGNDISIAHKLTQDGKVNGAPVSGVTLHVSPEGIVTLGDGTDTGLTELSGSGITKLTIRDGLNVNVANNGFFVMNGDAESISFVNSDPNWTSEVNGNLEFTSSQRTPIKGQWVFNDDVKLTGTSTAVNTLIIGPWNGGTDAAKADKITYDTHVAFEGQIINGAANSNYYTAILAQTNGLDGVETTVDFTQATLSSPNGDNSGLLSLQASDNAVMKFNGNQFSQILSTSKSNGVAEAGDGFGLSANRGGTIEVTTPVTGEYDFAKFHAKQSGQTDGSYYEQQVTFDGAGILSINGDLGLYTGDKENAETAGQALDIGSGTIKAKQISLTNYHITDDKTNTYEAVTLKSGTLAVSQGLTVNRSDTLNVGAAAGDVAGIVLESDTLTGTGTLAVSKDVNLNGSGSIDVVQGAWSTEANIYAKGTGGLVLANSKVNADDLAENTYAASFVGKNFKAEGTGTAISAAAGTKATFDTMQLADSSRVELTNGHLLVNGANVTLGEGERPADNPAYVTPDANKTSTTAGIDFGTATIEVTGAQGVMEFGELATSKLLSFSGDTAQSLGRA